MAIDLNQVPGIPVIGQEQQPDVSSIGSFGRGAAGMLPLGEQGYAGIASAFENKPYSQERGELAREIEQDIQENPGSRLLGQAAGIIAPAVATGGASVPESLSETALKGAGIGSTFGVGNAIDTKASGGSNLQALGDIGMGVGVGALGGLAGKGISNALEGATENLGKSATVQRFLTEQQSKAMGLTPISIGRLAQERGTTPQSLINEFADRLKTEPNIPPDFWSMTSNVNDKESFGLASKNQAGQTLGMIKDAAGNYTHIGNTPGEFFPEGQQVIDDLRKAANDYKGINRKIPDSLRDYADMIENDKRLGKLDFNTLSQYKTAVGAELQKEDSFGAAQAYNILKTKLNQTVDRLPSPVGVDPAVYQQAKKTYQLWSELLPLMTRGAAREMASNVGGLSSTLGSIGALTGHPQAMIPALGNRLMKAAAPEGIANLVVGGGLKSTVKSFGNTFPRAGAQIGASQAQPMNKQQIVQDFVRQQSDPNYAKAKKDQR